MRLFVVLLMVAAGCAKEAGHSPDLREEYDAPDLAESPDLGDSPDLGSDKTDLAEKGDLALKGDLAMPAPILSEPIWIGCGGAANSRLGLACGGFDVGGETVAPSGAHFGGGFFSFQTY